VQGHVGQEVRKRRDSGDETLELRVRSGKVVAIVVI
jgi:hypothetical protein